VTFNCAIFRTIQGATSTTGTKAGPRLPADGTLGSIKNPAIGIFPRSTGTPSEILTNGFLSVSITDRLTQTTICRIEEVKATTYNFSITARGIVGTNISFNGVRMSDESQL
jgi:hypothetical protein